MKKFFSGLWRKFRLECRLVAIESEKKEILARNQPAIDSIRFVALLDEQTRIEIQLHGGQLQSA